MPKAEGRNGKGQFAPGNSGRPKGARGRIALVCETLLEGKAQALTEKAIALALAGDTVALRLCIERLAPLRRDHHVTFDMPAIAGAEDHPKALSAILTAVAAGELTPSEGQSLALVLAEHRKAIETEDHEQRLRTLEGDRDARD